MVYNEKYSSKIFKTNLYCVVTFFNAENSENSYAPIKMYIIKSIYPLN